MQCGKPALLGFVAHEKDDVKKGLKEVKHSQPFSGIFGMLQHHPQPCAMVTLGVCQRNCSPCIC